MSEEMVPLNKFLEELVGVVDERLRRQERNIFALEKRMAVLEKVVRDTNTGRVNSGMLEKLKK